jgi:hypothetical protein
LWKEEEQIGPFREAREREEAVKGEDGGAIDKNKRWVC